MSPTLGRLARGLVWIGVAAPLFARGPIVPERKKVPCTDVTVAARPGWTALLARIGWGNRATTSCAPEPREPPEHRDRPQSVRIPPLVIRR